MKKISTLVAVLVALAASPVAAQSAYYPATSAGACVGLARNLSSGMRGSDIRSLQQFLLERNYPGSGSWMVTGFYGRATAAAVRNFQGSQGISQNGIVDGNTRLAIDRISCGPHAASVQLPQETNYFPTPLFPTTYALNPAATQVYGALGSAGYTPFPCGSSYGYISTVANNCPCTSSNQQYYGNNFPNYSNGCSNALSASISSLSPAQGSVGASVTVFGSGFSATNNTIRFGDAIIGGLNSVDGKSLSFIVPSQLGFGQSLVIGTYPVTVSNEVSSVISKPISFSVLSVGVVGAPSVVSLSGPTTLTAGTVGQWSLTFTNYPNYYNYGGANFTLVSADWGDAQYGSLRGAPEQIYGTGTQQSATLTHTYAQPGTYIIRFSLTNATGQSSIAIRTVTVSGTAVTPTGAVSLSALAPTSGTIGTQLILTGNGFTQENTIRFGTGGTQHVPSYNGTTLYFTIPQYLSPCDVLVQGSVCALYLPPVTPGQYPLSVTNANGTSQTMYFQVQ